ncbi:MAG TPA: hypothetical protein VKS98_03495 [Chthoniobacterales bacterium]|nr:hypothetical protein [Chthoniobacterales bacterium]
MLLGVGDFVVLAGFSDTTGDLRVDAKDFGFGVRLAFGVGDGAL